MPRLTLDEMMLDAMLSPDPITRIAALARQHLDTSRASTTCPDCGDTGPHDDNGATRRDELAYSCRACGMCFDAER